MSKVRIETPNRNLILIHDLVVNYDRTPAQAIKGLTNDPLIASDFPQALWSGGKTGIKKVTIPIYWPRRCFSPSQGREMQRNIGYGWPAELAALRRKEVRRALWNMGIYWLISLCQSNEMLWRDHDKLHKYLRSVSLSLRPDCPSFNLVYASFDSFGTTALVGESQEVEAIPKN